MPQHLNAGCTDAEVTAAAADTSAFVQLVTAEDTPNQLIAIATEFVTLIVPEPARNLTQADLDKIADISLSAPVDLDAMVSHAAGVIDSAYTIPSSQVTQSPSTITFASPNISWSVADNDVFELAMTGNSTLNEPTGLSGREIVTVFISQDGAGSRTLNLAAFNMKTASNLSATPNAVDVLTLRIKGTGDIDGWLKSQDAVGSLDNVVEDLSPQLGGNLDLNSFSIVFPTTTIADALDEDDMVSNSATALATQQSIKAYVDSVAGGLSAADIDTLAELNAIVTDATLDDASAARPPTAHTHALSAITNVTATAAEVNLLDLAGLTAGWVLSADSASTASWKAPPSGLPLTTTYSGSVTTTDATLTNILTINTVANRAYRIEFTVVAVRNDMTQAAGYGRSAVFRNNAGTLSIVGTAAALGGTQEDNPAWDIQTTNNSTQILINVAGAASVTINWVITARLVEVA